MGYVHATLPKRSKCICENRQPGAGVGVVVTVGVCAERYSFTHLWADCCCSWRGSQRCCWMPWHGNPSGAEPLTFSQEFGQESRERQKLKGRGCREDENLWSSEMGAQPRIGLWLPQESWATSLRRAQPPPGDIWEKGERRDRVVESNWQRWNWCLQVSQELTRAGDERGTEEV